MASQLPDNLLFELDARYRAVGTARIDGDSALASRRYAEFERFCRDQTSATGYPAFLCALAVITEDDDIAIKLFHEALSLARVRGDRAHDILYPLAIRHLYRDEFDLAKSYALDSRADAIAEGDHEAAEQATQMIEEIDSHAA